MPGKAAGFAALQGQFVCVVLTQRLPPLQWCFYLAQVIIVCFPIELLISKWISNGFLCCWWCPARSSALLSGIFIEKGYLCVSLHSSRGLLIPLLSSVCSFTPWCGWDGPCRMVPISQCIIQGTGKYTPVCPYLCEKLRQESLFSPKSP